VFTLTQFASIRREIDESRQETSHNINDAFASFGNMVYQSQRSASEIQEKRLADLNERVSQMSAENSRQLERMRDTVDEKLQKTLDTINQMGSFDQALDYLDQNFNWDKEATAYTLFITALHRRFG
jgi:DNA recombination protein RmuC